MKISTVVFSLLGMSLLLTGCGKKSVSASDLNTSPAVQTIFVKGDPTQLLAGSTLNQESFISANNLQNFNEFALSSVTQYTEKEELVEDNRTHAEEGNEAPEESRVESKKEEKAVNTYSFVKNGREVAYLGSNGDSNGLRFVFKEVNNKIGITGVYSQNYLFELKPLHYSLKKSGEAFSILAEYKGDPNFDGKILIAFTFVRKSPEKEIGVTSTIYKYLLGAGVKVGWTQGSDLEVNICGKQHWLVEGAYKRGIQDWNSALSGRLTVKTNVLSIYPPFSDLNTNCIYTVPDYLTRTDKFINMASTITKFNLFEGKLIDSDIMFWVKENEKTGVPYQYVSDLQQTAAHEFGHLLGLHHQFDKSVTSIMSYDSNVLSVADYDEKAVAELYPRIN